MIASSLTLHLICIAENLSGSSKIIKNDRPPSPTVSLFYVQLSAHTEFTVHSIFVFRESQIDATKVMSKT